jgi:hypothetical protein
MLGLAVAQLAATTSGRVGLAVATSTFFAIVGVGLLVCGRGLLRANSWARSPAVVAQLIFALTAWSLREVMTVTAAALAAVAILTLAGLLSPGVARALAAEPD